jgi:nicotinamidase-related amidase
MSGRCALLLIDFINTLEFDGGAQLAPRAVEAARRTAGLKQRAIAEGLPVIYVNDSFGDWSGNFSAVVERCRRSRLGAPLAGLLCPTPDDASILKPRHSAFYGTPLEFLLDEHDIDALILTGLQTHMCVLFSAHDAYLRRYRMWIPGDCVAAESEAEHTAALAHAERVTSACVESSAGVSAGRLADVFSPAGRFV